MYLFIKNKKLISCILTFTIFTSFLPIFSTKTEAQTQAAAGATILTTAATTNTASCLTAGLLDVGTGQICDIGVRFNTYSILSSMVGVAPGVAQKEDIWDKIGYFAARILIRQLSQSIIDWINGGFNGNPSFIQDPQQFMTDTGDRVIGEFIYSSDLKFLCDPFETNIRLNLGLQYSPFKDKINCTLSEVLMNTDQSIKNAYTDFMNGDFINGGGWDSWLNITTNPQNNQLGAMIISQAELDAQIGDKKLDKENELKWSGGLLSMKNCTRTAYDTDGTEITHTDYTGDPILFTGTVGATSTSARGEYTDGNWTGSTVDTCKVVTPGTWITGTGNKVLGMDLDALGVADEINEIVGALANFVVSKVMEKGMALVTHEDLSSDNPDWQAGLDDLQAQQDAEASDAMNSASSGGDYTSDYSSHSNEEGSGDGTTEDATQIAEGKTYLQGYITTALANEQAYYNIYNYIYGIASSTVTKYLGVVSCYNTKIASTTLALTASEITTANTQAGIASTTASSTALVRDSIYTGRTSSQTNLTSLQTIYSAVTAATTLDELIAQQTNLVSLVPSLHGSSAVATAQAMASTTSSQIIASDSIADTMQDTCTAFPVR